MVLLNAQIVQGIFYAKLIPKTQHGPFFEPENASPTPLRSYENRDRMRTSLENDGRHRFQ
jgi:hypothetical protein